MGKPPLSLRSMLLKMAAHFNSRMQEPLRATKPLVGLLLIFLVVQWETWWQENAWQ